MIATLPPNGAAHRSRIAELPSTRQTPPSERDFEVYLALAAECISTRAAAERFGISQTRVLQVRDRVAEWLGTTLLPMRSLSARQRVQVLGEMARHRIEFLLSQAVEAWHASKGTTTKVRVGESFNEVTTTYTTHGDIRYLIGASRLNNETLKLAEALEAALARVDGLSATHAAPGTPQRAFPTACDPSTSPEGDCSREEGVEAGARLAPETQADASGDDAEGYDEFAERRREFLAALDDNTAPVQPPRTDANGMLIEETSESQVMENLSLLPMAAGAERLAGSTGDAPSLTRRASMGRPLSRKERRARKRMLEKLRRKAK